MPAFVIGMIGIWLMIGLRYHVGGDWIAYIQIYNHAQYHELAEIGKHDDPGYYFLNWAGQKLGLRLWFVNLACGVVFSWGLAKFARTTPNPWTALVVAIPYLVIVVAMGYSRQGVAIGILMMGIADFQRKNSLVRVAVYIFVAALFHKTAVVCLPLFFFGARGSKAVNLALLVAFSLLFYRFFLEDSMGSLVKNYVGAEYSSSGALTRIALSAVPASLFLLLKKRFPFSNDENRVWSNFSYMALAMLVFLAISPSSTAVDRIALYLLPLEIAVLAAVPTLSRDGKVLKVSVIAFSFLVQFTWLTFGIHAAGWIPYRTYLSADR